MTVQYEILKANNQFFYMDGGQLTDIADQYTSGRRFKGAQEVISYELGLHPGHTNPMIGQAYLSLGLNQPRKAREVAGLITDTYSTNVKLLLAEPLLDGDKLDDTDQILDNVEEEEKDELDTLVDVIYLYTNLDYPERGIQQLTRGVELYKDDEDFLVAAADCHGAAETTHIEKATLFYNKLVDKNPYNPAYWMRLAKCQFAIRDLGKTAESCDFAIAADEEFDGTHIIRAYNLFRLENTEGTIVEYQKALEYKALSPEFTYMFIGLAYARQENWAEATESYRLALQAIEESGNGSFPLLSDIYSNKAVCISRLSDSAEVHHPCRLVKELAPQDTESYLLEGHIYMGEGNFDQVRAEWALAFYYVPEANAWMGIGNYNLEYRMSENTRLCFEQVLEEDPEYPKACEQLAFVYLVLQDHEGLKKYNGMCSNSIGLESLRNMILGMGADEEQILRELDDFLKDRK